MFTLLLNILLSDVLIVLKNNINILLTKAACFLF